MLKSSAIGSLAFIPLLFVGCGSDGSDAGAGGSNSAGANSGGGAHVNGGSGGSAGKAGENSGGEAMGGSDDMAGAGGEADGSGGANAGAGGSSAGRGGIGGNAGAAGGSAGASAGQGGAAGSSAGSGGASGRGGAAGGGGASGSGGAGGTSGGTGGGSSCSTTVQCAGSQVCIASVCTPCDGVAFASGNTVYFVDPANGSDSNGTGSGKSGGQVANACAFKTITRALQVIGSPTQASGAIVKLKGNASTASGETFPISVPQYVVIQGATGPVTVTLAAQKVGFNFAGTGSVLKDLLLEGGGTSDVAVLVPADAAATLDAVTVQNTGATAVDVLAGTLTLLAGTTIQMAGTSQAHRAGITVEGTGKLVAKIASGRVSVIKNTAQGIRVIGRGSVDLEGVVTSNTGTIPTTYNGTIVISQNSEADIELNQTGATPPLNTIKGVLATGSVTSDGLLIRGGTAAYVRRSVFVGNGLSGIHLSYTGTKANGNSDMTAVDLGKTADLGLNVVQGANDQLNNKGSGICININPTPVQVVSAQGNLFSVADCSTTVAALTKNVGVCGPVGTAPGDLGWEWLNTMNTSRVTVDAAKCSN